MTTQTKASVADLVDRLLELERAFHGEEGPPSFSDVQAAQDAVVNARARTLDDVAAKLRYWKSFEPSRAAEKPVQADERVVFSVIEDVKALAAKRGPDWNTWADMEELIRNIKYGSSNVVLIGTLMKEAPGGGDDDESNSVVFAGERLQELAVQLSALYHQGAEEETA